MIRCSTSVCVPCAIILQNCLLFCNPLLQSVGSLIHYIVIIISHKQARIRITVRLIDGPVLLFTWSSWRRTSTSDDSVGKLIIFVIINVVKLVVAYRNLSVLVLLFPKNNVIYIMYVRQYGGATFYRKQQYTLIFCRVGKTRAATLRIGYKNVVNK